MNRKEYVILTVPLIISMAITLILYSFMDDYVKINNFDMISNNYINFVSILVGFLITTITIVIGFFDKKIIKAITRSKKQKVLYINWFITILAGIFSILFSFYVAAIFDNNINQINKNPFTIVILFTLVFIIYLTISLIYFFGIASAVMKENMEEEIIEIPMNNLKLPKNDE